MSAYSLFPNYLKLSETRTSYSKGSNLNEIQYAEKFIAFFDVLGWKSLVLDSDAGCGLSLGELCEITDMLGTAADRDEFKKYGPTICPEAPRTRKGMGFRITQVSDSVLISAEISPAGLINLVFHCWRASTRLLSKGVMCRGCIKRGPIYHTSEYQIGVGINDVVDREKRVSIFRKANDESGTPFIEIDVDVVQYVECQPDKCVKEVFSRLVERDNDLAAIFPFKRLDPGLFYSAATFNPDKERKAVDYVRGRIQRMKKLIQNHINPSHTSAYRKAAQYTRMLDAQLVVCDRHEEMIDLSAQPAVKYTSENWPGRWH